MMTLLVVILLAWNVFVSYWNARVCGMYWAESKAMGGWQRLVVWCGAIQSAIGFSMLYILGLGFGTTWLGLLPHDALKPLFSMYYLAIVFPAIGTGLIITVHSIIEAYKNRDFFSIGVATYNTLASAHNIYSASTGIGDAFSSISDFVKSSTDDDPKGFVLVALIILVLVSLAAGAMTTYALIQKYAGTLPLPSAEKQTVAER